MESLATVYCSSEFRCAIKPKSIESCSTATARTEVRQEAGGDFKGCGSAPALYSSTEVRSTDTAATTLFCRCACARLAYTQYRDSWPFAQ